MSLIVASPPGPVPTNDDICPAEEEDDEGPGTELNEDCGPPAPPEEID